MISIDTNILLPAVEISSAQHAVAAAFLESLQDREDVVISELIILELYGLPRSPTVLAKPLSASAAVDVCESFRQHPLWQVVGFPPNGRHFHDTFWPRLRAKDFARHRAFDWRAARSLLQQGVTDFATANEKDLQGFGFARVWNPLTA
jgi:predicted nucleic acid-binding protein